MLYKYIFAFFIAFLIISNVCLAQSPHSEKYRLAESFEKSGDFKNASRLYYELYLTNKKNKDYFIALVRTYKAQNNFSGIIPLIEEQLNFYKNSEIYSLYGEILWRIGKIEDANNAWENALQTAPYLEKTYLDVYQSQSLVLQFEKAIATLLRGRDKIEKNNQRGKSSLFSDQLTQLYIASGNYIKGIEEIFLLFEESGDFAMAQGRIAALMYNQKATDYIEDYLKQKSKANQSNLRLYSWLLRAIKKYEEALEIIKKIDQLGGNRGSEVFNFGYASMNDKQYDIALSAFGWVIDLGSKYQYYAQALYGYARTLEYRIREKDSLTDKEITDIINRYRHIIKSTNNPINISDALYRIALLEYEYLKDSSSAVEDILELTQKYPSYPIVATSLNLLGDIYLIGDNINEARKTFIEILQKYKQVNVVEYNKAQYKLAEIEFFNGNIDSAFTLFAKLSLLSDNDIANDALNMLVLFEQNKDFKDALKLYAEAKLKAKQKRMGDAEIIYEKISKEFSNSSIAELALIELANIRLDKYDIISARELLLSLLDKYPDTIYGDFVLLSISRTYEIEKNIEQAIHYLSELLAKYPRSIYLQKARDKIKILRENKKS